MKRGAVAAVVAAILAIGGQGCSPSLNQACKADPSCEPDLKALSDRIQQMVQGLGYSEQTAKEFVGMTTGWQNKRGRPVILTLSTRVADARQRRQQEQISGLGLARIEQDVTRDLVAEVRRQIRVNDKFFQLTDVIKHRKAQCLGYTQVLYATAGAINLSVTPINVLELETPGPLPAGCSHVAGIVNLSDGSTIMVEPVPGGFVSDSFILEREFKRVGIYRELNDKANPLGIYRKIQLLDADGLIAYRCTNQGNVNAEMGQQDKALAEHTKAIELAGTLAEAWNNRGTVLRNMGRLDEAMSDYDKALELNPDYAEGWNNRGIAREQQRQPEAAIQDFTKAIGLNPGFAQAYSNRGNAYAALGEFNEAISDYDNAIKRDSGLARAYGNRGVNYALLGKQEQAKKDLVTAASLSPDLADYVRKVSERFNLGLD